MTPRLFACVVCALVCGGTCSRQDSLSAEAFAPPAPLSKAELIHQHARARPSAFEQVAERGASRRHPTDVEAVEEKSESDALQVIKQVVEVWAAGMSILMYGSSFPVLREIRKRQSTAGYDVMPYAAMWLNAAAQVNYVFHHSVMTYIGSFVANGTALLLSTFTMFFFGFYVTDPKTWKRYLLICAGTWIPMGAAVLLSWWPHRMDCVTSGLPWTSCWWSPFLLTINCIMFFGPLSIIMTVWKTQSTEFFPLSTATSTFACAVPWTLYGICLMDYAIYAPNILGVVLSFLQLLVYYVVTSRAKAGQLKPERDNVHGSFLGPTAPEPALQQCASYGALADLANRKSVVVETPTGSQATG